MPAPTPLVMVQCPTCKVPVKAIAGVACPKCLDTWIKANVPLLVPV